MIEPAHGSSTKVNAGRARWLGNVLQAVPVEAWPEDAAELESQLAGEGATGRTDFERASPEELRGVWPCLRGCADAFLVELARPAGQAKRGRAQGEQHAGVQQVLTRDPVAVDVACADREVLAALELLATARASNQVPQPRVLADAIQAVARTPADRVQLLLQRNHGLSAKRPRDRVESWRPQDAQRAEMQALCELVWREFQSWHKSGLKYVSPVRLWGAIAEKMQVDPWPPSDGVLGGLAIAVQNGPTFLKYCGQVRSVLRLVKADLGSLSNTAGLARGASKANQTDRFRPRASAKQTRDLAKHLTSEGQSELADSFVVARQFCFRYGSEVIPLTTESSHSSVHLEEKAGRWEATVRLHQRKMCQQSVAVTRRCICELQTPLLCGVCALRRRPREGRLFANLSYGSALASLKVACGALNFPRASEWGTHAFRRGWADEVLAQGGVPALFHSGGWQGVSAFGYANASTRGAVSAAEWLIEFSESSASDART